jgi:CHAT domain-containing protein
MGDTSLFSFYIDKDTFMVLRQSLNAGFFDQAYYLLSHLSHLDFEMPYEQRKRNLIRHTRYFYKKMIACFPEDLILNNKRLYIVPDEILAMLPYEIFLSEDEEENTPYSSLSYLLKNVSIVYAPSSTLLLKSFAHESRHTPYDLGVFSSSELYSDKRYNAETDIEMKGVVEESSYLKKNYQAHVYTGPWASKQSFDAIAGKYKILHISSHGDIDDREPMFSRLSFADHDADTMQNDLFVHELFNMNLRADLAVLSACNTGSGKLQKGEGIMTIARGFQYAGIPGIVMSLWKVSDYSTQKIIHSFYRHLKSGEPKDQALLKAKIEYLEEADNLISDPFFWAALIQIGNPAPVYKKTPVHSKAYGFFLCLNVLFLAIVIKSSYFRKI